MNRKKYLIKNTIIFTLGNLGTKLISFFLVPLYTSVLSTDQYGTVDLITTIIMIAVPIIFLNIGESVMRFALDKDADLNGIMSIGFCAAVFSIIPGVIIAIATRFYNPIANYSVYIFFYSFTMGVSQILLCYLRGREMLVKYSIGNILQTFFIALFNILFLLRLKKGIEGYFMSYVLAYTVVIFYCIVVSDVKQVLRFFHINKSLAKEMIKYSVVLIPNSFMWWIMNSSDRIMVTSMVGIAANGIYAISYKLPSIISTMASIFNQAWSYSAIKEEGAKDETEYNNKILKMMVVFMMTIGIAIITISKLFLEVYVSKEYYEAWKYIPFLTIGCVYMTFGSFVATSYTVHKDSFGFLFSSIFGAVLNIVLNFVLIPILDVYGAAIATCTSYIAVFLFRLIHTKKYLQYKVITKEFVIGACIMGISSVLLFFDSTLCAIIQWSLLLLYIIIGKKEWSPILEGVLSKIKRKV